MSDASFWSSIIVFAIIGLNFLMNCVTTSLQWYTQSSHTIKFSSFCCRLNRNSYLYIVILAMEFQKIGLNGGRMPCFRFWEDMMICIKEESIQRSFYKCNKEKADYKECLHNTKLVRSCKHFLFVLFWKFSEHVTQHDLRFQILDKSSLFALWE